MKKDGTAKFGNIWFLLLKDQSIDSTMYLLTLLTLLSGLLQALRNVQRFVETESTLELMNVTTETNFQEMDVMPFVDGRRLISTHVQQQPLNLNLALKSVEME